MMRTARIVKANDTSSTARRWKLADLNSSADADSLANEFEPMTLLASEPCVSPTSLEPRMRTAMAALESAVEKFQAERDAWLEQCRAETVRLAVAIAEHLMARTLEIAPESVIEKVRSVLKWADGAKPARVRVHPLDAELIAAAWPHGSAVELNIEADESLSRGDCVVDLPNGCVDARREVLLARVTEELLMS
jgi:flagellar biosynthesis/type III secretory pathway protein FliH